MTDSIGSEVPHSSDLKSSVDGKHKPRKKKNKPVDDILKDLSTNATGDEKLDLLCRKYEELSHSLKDSNARLKQLESLVQSLRNERDQLQTERSRLILQKDKLETLCRELQKQNKVIQEESLARTRAEDEKRREVSDHFQSGIMAIQTQLNEYQTRNNELRQDNQDLAEKLGKFIEQHGKREEHVEKVLQARELEVKLAEAKLNKTQCLLDQERVKSQQEVLRMQNETKLMQERLDMHLALEGKLKEQIEFYKMKYQNFNKTIAQSNKLFDNAKSEMDKLAKRVKQSERDVVEWRGKWELSQRSLLEVIEEHKKKVDEAASARKQANRLASLCRAFQAQLAELRRNNTNLETLESTDLEVPTERGDEFTEELLDERARINENNSTNTEVDVPNCGSTNSLTVSATEANTPTEKKDEVVTNRNETDGVD